jgi:hypothetical protein
MASVPFLASRPAGVPAGQGIPGLETGCVYRGRFNVINRGPLAGAVCTPPELRRLAGDMVKAESKWLPRYQKYDRARS